MIPASDALLYMHISKTAGTSVRGALTQAYRPHERAFIYDRTELGGAIDEATLRATDPAQLARLRLIMGHFHFGLHEVLPQDTRYVTMLRDPLDRVVSLYSHYRAHRAGGSSASESLNRLVHRGEVSLEDWVFAEPNLQADNAMVRVITARRGVPFGRCPDDMLSQALDHVDRHFAALLVSERMTHSRFLLEVVVGRPLPDLPRANVTPRRMSVDEVEPSLARRIRELNHLDQQLYATAVARLEALEARLRT